MTLDSLILLEDALEMNAKGFTKDEFVGCVKESFRPVNAQAWDDRSEERRVGKEC